MAAINTAHLRVPSLRGQAMDEVDDRGEPTPITDDTLLVLLNAQSDPVFLDLPDAHPGPSWKRLVDTAFDQEALAGGPVSLGGDRSSWRAPPDERSTV